MTTTMAPVAEKNMRSHNGPNLKPIKGRLNPTQITKRMERMHARSMWRQMYAAKLNETRVGAAVAIQRTQTQARFNRYLLGALAVAYLALMGVVGRVLGWW